MIVWDEMRLAWQYLLSSTTSVHACALTLIMINVD